MGAAPEPEAVLEPDSEESESELEEPVVSEELEEPVSEAEEPEPVSC